MGCCCSRSEYKAKETLYPDLDIFADCPQEDTPNGGEKKESKEERLKKEIALQIDIEGKLKMLKEDTGLVGHGGVKLFKIQLIHMACPVLIFPIPKGMPNIFKYI